VKLGDEDLQYTTFARLAYNDKIAREFLEGNDTFLLQRTTEADADLQFPRQTAHRRC